MQYCNMDRNVGFQSNRELLIGWIDHIMYNCDGIDEYFAGNFGVEIDIESLKAMSESELEAIYLKVADVRDYLQN